MATIARRAPRQLITAQLVGVRIPIWFAVVGSRLIVLAAGAGGALFTHRVSGWQIYDPTGISSGLGSVGNVLGASAVRWDATGYITLAAHGYTTTASTVLFPLYPLLLRAGSVVVGSPVIAGVLISLVAFTVGLALVHRIASEELGSRTADATVLLLAFSPFSFVFSAVYTESLLLALSAGALYLARRDRFVLACVAAAAATLTHVQGILLVVPLAVMYWKSCGRPRSLRRLLPGALVLTLQPLALAGFFIYTHTQGWGWFAPITNQNPQEAGRTFVGPPIMLFDSVKDVVIGLNQTIHGVAPHYGSAFAPGIQNIIYLGALTIAVLALRSAWRRLPIEYALFALLAILVCTSSAVSMEPLKGFDRYMLPIFPLWIAAAAWLEERNLTAAVVTVSTVMLIFYTTEFSRWVSVF
jgi:Dolichyl-phosphate-mannose-protein mannosyltransferase